MSTSDLVIRRATPEDRAALYSWYTQPERWSFLKRQPRVQPEQNREWFDSLLHENKADFLCIGLIDIIRIGAIRFNQQTNEEFSAYIVLRPPYLGFGLAPKFLRAGSRFLHETFPGVIVRCRIPLPGPGVPRENTLALYNNEGITISGVSDSDFIASVGGNL